MNLDQLKKNTGFHVQLEPVAIRLDDSGRELPPMNDDWLIEEVADTGIRISNIRTGHSTILGKDHIHHFTSNPGRSISGGIQRGFLTLLVQVYLQGNSLSIRPCARPGEPVPPHPIETAEKRVDLRYPSDSGLQAQLEARGYRVAWCFESRLARKVEIEGWEIVVEDDHRGVPTTFHIRDRPENQVLIKTQSPDLEALAARANDALRLEVGFLGCTVHTFAPPVLAYRFASPTDAVRFQLGMNAQGSPFRYAMAPGRIDTVLEHRG